jgi:hypothetical protein
MENIKHELYDLLSDLSESKNDYQNLLVSELVSFFENNKQELLTILGEK